MRKSSELTDWGQKLPQGAKRCGGLGTCPECGYEYGDMIVDWHGLPNSFLLQQVIGFSRHCPISKANSVGVVVIECPKCFQKSWFHVEEPWALAVREFSPHSPLHGKVRNELTGEELEDALGNMTVFRTD